MVLTNVCIAKITVFMNWKNKNNPNSNHYRDRLKDHISLPAFIIALDVGVGTGLGCLGILGGLNLGAVVLN